MKLKFILQFAEMFLDKQYLACDVEVIIGSYIIPDGTVIDVAHHGHT
jgi:hypothetical protein